MSMAYGYKRILTAGEQLHLQNADQKTQVGFIIKSTRNCQGFYQAHRQAYQFIEVARISESKLIVHKALLEKFFVIDRSAYNAALAKRKENRGTLIKAGPNPNVRD
jgi:hypothetical protein